MRGAQRYGKYRCCHSSNCSPNTLQQSLPRESRTLSSHCLPPPTSLLLATHATISFTACDTPPIAALSTLLPLSLSPYVWLLLSAMVAIKTLIPKQLPSVRVLLISIFTWSWMMSWLTISFLVMSAAYPVLHILPLTAARRSYWQGWLFRVCTSPFMYLHPLWRQTIVHGRQPVTWSEWWQQQVLRDGLSGQDGQHNGQSLDRLPRRLLICSNHVSDLDPFCTAAALVPLESKYIAKSSLFSIPVGGWCMRMAGDIAVHFTAEKGGWGLKKGSVPVMFAECKRAVEAGMPIVVYPEGTRDGTLAMKPFKKGMFDFAVENGCSVLPIAMDGPQRCWPFPGPWFDRGHVRIAFGEIIPPSKDAQQLLDTTRAAIQQLINTLVPGADTTGKATAPSPSAASTVPSTHQQSAESK